MKSRCLDKHPSFFFYTKQEEQQFILQQQLYKDFSGMQSITKTRVNIAMFASRFVPHSLSLYNSI